MLSFSARPRSTWSTDQLKLDRAMYHDARDVFAVTGDATLQAEAELMNGFAAIACGDGAESRACTTALNELSAGGGIRLRCECRFFLAQMISALEGRLVEAEALSLEQWEAWQTVNLAEAITFRSVQRYAGKREQGRLAEIVSQWHEYLTTHPLDAAAASMVAYALAVSGDVDEAAVRLHDAGRAEFRDIPDEAGWPIAVAMWIETAFLVGDRGTMRALYEIFLRYDGCMAATGGIIMGPGARLLGRAEYLLGETEAADHHFEAAIEMARNLGSPPWAAVRNSTGPRPGSNAVTRNGRDNLPMRPRSRSVR